MDWRNLIPFAGGKSASKAPVRYRHFDMAKMGRLTNDWKVVSQSPDALIRPTLRTIRGRSRELAVNNDYYKRFLRMVRRNVIGHQGIRLQVKPLQPDGKVDVGDKRTIETAWKKWCKKKYCSVDGRNSWLDIQQIAVETLARDGECLIRKVKGFNNPFGFALQLIEADMLDDQLNRKFSDGREISMGVEMDKWKKPVAYHILTQHPGDDCYSFAGQKYQRIPADEIIHLYGQERPQQTRGIPWGHTAATRLHMNSGYEEAELVAARVGASKMGFIQTESGDDYAGPEDEAGNMYMDAEPGIIEQLSEGQTFTSWDPAHPTSAFDQFEKRMLMGAAAGLDISYHKMANDLAGVNYSSGRLGELDERDAWKMVQTYMVEHLCEDVFEDWLTFAIMSGALALPMSKFDKFNTPIFRPRGWMWVDPQKEATANVIAVKSGQKTLSDIAAEQGRDFEEVVQQMAMDIELAEQYGITLNFDDLIITVEAKSDEKED